MSKNQATSNKQDLFQTGKDYRNPFISQDQPPLQNVTPFPGIFPSGGPPGGYPGGMYGGNFPTQQPAAGSGSFLDKLPLNDIKGFVDRMGGVEGVMNMVTKVNTMFKTFQQMSPMIKLLLGSFGSRAATANSKRNSHRKRKRSSQPQRRAGSYRPASSYRPGTRRKRRSRSR